jgi:hypothetical protein
MNVEPCPNYAVRGSDHSTGLGKKATNGANAFRWDFNLTKAYTIGS